VCERFSVRVFNVRVCNVRVFNVRVFNVTAFNVRVFNVRVFNCLRRCSGERSLYILIILQMRRICVKEWRVQ
jgi:hypothetical protein